MILRDHVICDSDLHEIEHIECTVEFNADGVRRNHLMGGPTDRAQHVLVKYHSAFNTVKQL